MSNYNSNNNGILGAAYKLGSILSGAAATGFGIAGLRHAYDFYQSGEHSVNAALVSSSADLTFAAGLGALTLYAYKKARNNYVSLERVIDE